jgi:hypothetical protein
MSTIKKWWPSLVAAAAALWGVFGPGIQQTISQHPAWVAGISGASVVIAHLMRSPLAASNN